MNDLAVIRSLLRWSRPVELPENHQWAHPDEPVLLEWRINARPYNTRVANAMFYGLASVALAVAFAFSADAFKPIGGFWLWGVSSLLLNVFIISLVTHQKTKFIYRFTRLGVECCKWKELSKGWLLFLKYVTIFTCAVVPFFILIDPVVFLIALAGPGGMGLLYLAMANSKEFQEMHRDIQTYNHPWSAFISLTADPGIAVISLETWDEEIEDNKIKWPFYIFSKRKHFNDHLKLIQSLVPHLTCETKRISVLQF
ncbi:hypothetical protein NRL37_19665 [Metapseudomonas otitidis]|uniref:hypothetical protein n=1 Tax=Metapseudomonas otitidis TaxID=319939 RepID=UPI00227ABA45|nr:hypothetical protein [Pseudomonas otitidis]WAF84297.1 hypothetical protein NRL37_19665 [Pseudomonas otitidis]